MNFSLIKFAIITGSYTVQSIVTFSQPNVTESEFLKHNDACTVHNFKKESKTQYLPSTASTVIQDHSGPKLSHTDSLVCRPSAFLSPVTVFLFWHRNFAGSERDQGAGVCFCHSFKWTWQSDGSVCVLVCTSAWMCVQTCVKTQEQGLVLTVVFFFHMLEISECQWLIDQTSWLHFISTWFGRASFHPLDISPWYSTLPLLITLKMCIDRARAHSHCQHAHLQVCRLLWGFAVLLSA